MALKIVDREQLITFFKDNILARFGVPKRNSTWNDSIFIGCKFKFFYSG
jgi:hypothetical protein